MKTILITGGSGMVGSKLTEKLKEKGYRVIWLSRERYIKAETPRYRWDYIKGEIDKEALEQADIIVHLAGSNIGDESWTRKKKQKIVESRVLTAKFLLETLKSMNKIPEAFISASAVGYYGMFTNENKIFYEKDLPARNDFLSRTCKKWESAAMRFNKDLAVRTVVLRTSLVIAKESDAFKKMILPTRYGLGAPFGNGKQFTSWIHLDDICELYLKSIEDVTLNGVYNAVAPEYITNKEFMRTVAKAMKRPYLIPSIPSFLIQLIMGESAGMILKGSRISPDKIINAGFKYKYNTAHEAINACLE